MATPQKATVVAKETPTSTTERLLATSHTDTASGAEENPPPLLGTERPFCTPGTHREWRPRLATCHKSPHDSRFGQHSRWTARGAERVAYVTAPPPPRRAALTSGEWKTAQEPQTTEILAKTLGTRFRGSHSDTLGEWDALWDLCGTHGELLLGTETRFQRTKERPAEQKPRPTLWAEKRRLNWGGDSGGRFKAVSAVAEREALR